MANLTLLSDRLTNLAGKQLAIAYYIGLQQAMKQTGIEHKWDETDQANVQLLTDQFKKQLEAKMNEIRRLADKDEIEKALSKLIAQSHTWAWTASPALAMGKTRIAQLLEAQKEERTNILPLVAGALLFYDNNDTQETNDSLSTIITDSFDKEDEFTNSAVSNNEPVGIIWYTAEDDRVCYQCDYLNGRWFPSEQAYQIASSIHPNCRCPAHFIIGTPSDASVGPIGDYNANSTADDIFSHIGEEARNRYNRERRQIQSRQTRQHAVIPFNAPKRGRKKNV